MNDQKTITIWQDEKQLEQIKQIYCKDLNEQEANIFFGIGKSTGLNPFLREIWAVKYGTSPASMFIGRDGYRKSAQGFPEYDYHIADAVYQNDNFTIEDGKIKHSYSLKDRGVIIGAYCSVKRKSSSMPMFQYVEFTEYYQGNKGKDGKILMKTYQGKSYPAKETLWDTKPATMIKKVAEAQALRMAFQELFAGTYDDSENWMQEKSTPIVEEKKEIVIEKNDIISAMTKEITASKIDQDLLG